MSAELIPDIERLNNNTHKYTSTHNTLFAPETCTTSYVTKHTRSRRILMTSAAQTHEKDAVEWSQPRTTLMRTSVAVSI